MSTQILKNGVVSHTIDDAGVFEVTKVSVASAPICSYISYVIGLPVAELSLAINPTQSGSGDPAPDNIRPITGVSSVNVNNSGDNTYTTSGIAAISAATITVLSTDSFRIQRASAWSSTKQTKTSLGIEVGKMYCLVCDIEYTSGTAYIAIRNSSNAIQSGTGKIFESKKVYFYFTLANPTDYLSFFCSYNESVGDVTYKNIRLYEIKNTYTIALGDTYYGATLDVVRGKLVVNWVSVDLKNLYYTKSASGLFATTGLASAIKKVGSSTTVSPYIKSSIFSVIDSNSITGPQGTTPSPNGVMAENMSGYIYFNYTDVTTVDDFKNAMDGVDFIYELATPIEIDLTPTQINSLLGSNNIWHDGNGDTSCKHYEITGYSLDGLFENNPQNLSISQTSINSTEFIET